MSCRAKSRSFPPKRSVTLRGGSCCRRIVKDAFHLPQGAGKQESPVLRRRHSPSKWTARNASSSVKNGAIVKQPRQTHVGESAGPARKTGGKTDSQVGGNRQNGNSSARHETEPVVRNVSVGCTSESESGGPPMRRTGQSLAHHGSVIAPCLPPAKNSNPSWFRRGPASPCMPFRPVAFPPSTFVNASRGTVGRGMAQQWQHCQAMSHYGTVQPETRTTQGGVLSSTTTASSPSDGNDSRNHNGEQNGQRLVAGNMNGNRLGSVVTKNTLEANNVVTTLPEQTREQQRQRQSWPCAYHAQKQDNFGGQQDTSLGGGSANPVQMREATHQDASVGRKRKTADLMEGEERPRKNDARSADVSRALSYPAPPAAADNKATAAAI